MDIKENVPTTLQEITRIKSVLCSQQFNYVVLIVPEELNNISMTPSTKKYQLRMSRKLTLTIPDKLARLIHQDKSDYVSATQSEKKK